LAAAWRKPHQPTIPARRRGREAGQARLAFLLRYPTLSRQNHSPGRTFRGFSQVVPSNLANEERSLGVIRTFGLTHVTGGRVIDRGDFVPGEPYLFFQDPDGYLVEVWYEPRTPLDPPEER
jgi:hypothetical protein